MPMKMALTKVRKMMRNGLRLIIADSFAGDVETSSERRLEGRLRPGSLRFGSVRLPARPRLLDALFRILPAAFARLRLLRGSAVSLTWQRAVAPSKRLRPIARGLD